MPQINPRTARAVVAVKVRDGKPPDEIAAARADLAEANAVAAVRKIVDRAPPLSAEARAKLAVILLGNSGT